MAITFRVLGGPGEDNALWVQVNGGQSTDRLLFDCGECCLHSVALADVQAVDHLLFSHLHMDHVGGFDSFFRANFARTDKPNFVWGPPHTSEILQHRFRGYIWNLHSDGRAAWRVHDVNADVVSARRYELAEAFAVTHDEGSAPHAGTIVESRNFRVDVAVMDHGTPSLAYVVREPPRRNVDPARLALLGATPGPWLKQVMEASAETMVSVGAASYSAGELRERLVVTRPGESLAYLTDFRLDDAAAQRLIPLLRGCTAIVCECQYHPDDAELAQRNYHMTADQAASLAARADIGRLVLFHVSQRYTPDGWRSMLRAARAVFPRAEFPEHWGLNEREAT